VEAVELGSEKRFPLPNVLGGAAGGLRTLFELLMLEIFRHIVEDASYRRCENENCRKLFVRQEGGAEHGQSRKTGVKYCSRHCAKATAQRNSRRRKAAAAARSAEADNGADASD
jgi:hypothetical protein